MKKTLILITVVSVLGVCSLRAEELLVPPGSEEWNEIFDPPFVKPTEIPKSSPLRKMLFDLVRPHIERQAKRPVQFEGNLRAFKNWALFTGRTVNAEGRSVKLPPMDNDDTVALWLRTRDGWRLVDFSGGHSDVFYLIWPEQYGVPKQLIGE